MKVYDLIELLESCNPEAEAFIAISDIMRELVIIDVSQSDADNVHIHTSI